LDAACLPQAGMLDAGCWIHSSFFTFHFYFAFFEETPASNNAIALIK
jgi:hypothetical protein